MGLHGRRPAFFSALLTLVLGALAVVEQRVAGKLTQSAVRARLVLGRELGPSVVPLPRRALVFGFSCRPPPVSALLM